ncbi:hypothetical protein N8I77_000475 [Diaporthe amygdali]|uniref:Uncharacterized protein n=1 Tax=Phomopsis amygdali TaxID=1214568 RepID=A0AAD9SM82_PHOAM|nr:hypothetical protein N8I77_000475 [Diaporthe amygdali]
MANNKENDPSSISGSTAGASTNNNSNLSKPTEDPKTKGGMNTNSSYSVHDTLDSVMRGACSTCGSSEHDTVRCDEKDAPECMMSGALQTGNDSAAAADYAAEDGGESRGRSRTA